MSSNFTTCTRWIGTDESGKGDYFGPLVVAGILVDTNTVKSFEELGIRDSKKLSESTIKDLAARIKRKSPLSIVAIGPEKYNELYAKIGNLNRLLAWGHSRVIENILDKEQCDYVLSDQFGDEKFIVQALMEKGKKIEVIQRARAESDIGVAAASILARAEFVQRLTALSLKYGIVLPKGASSQVIETGREFVKRYGSERLNEVAKIHFKTTKLVLAKIDNT
ncbi:MAG: ribonuclease HIII [Chloroflexota bacterium]|nr:ribonuclease HIII [Chloroflexota bacterium]